MERIGMKAYKWMLPGLVTPIQEKVWPVAVGEWTATETPVICESGWHGVEEKNVLNHLPGVIGAELWWVETRGKVVRGDDKFACESMRLLELIGVTTEQNLRLFACDCAEDALNLVSNPDPRSLNAIAVARRFAMGEATQDEMAAARAAARAAAGDAAGAGALAQAAARAAAGDAAGAGAAAGAAAWARAASRTASRAAARATYSNWLIVRLESGF